MHDKVPDILESFQNNSHKSLNIHSKLIKWALRCVGLLLRVSSSLYPSPYPLYWWASQFIILLSQSLYPFWHPPSFPVNKPLMYRLTMLQLFFCPLYHNEVTSCCMILSVQHYPRMTNNFFNLSDLQTLMTLNTQPYNVKQISSSVCTWQLQRVQDVAYRGHLVSSGLTDCLVIQHLQQRPQLAHKALHHH